MARQRSSQSSRLNAHIHSFNRGEVSAAALARTDLEPLRLAAEVQENLLPYVLGKGVVRPGTRYLATTPSSNRARLIPFVFSVSDKALLEMTDSTLRVYLDGALITRPAVTSTVTNGNFSATEGWITISRGGGTFSASGGVATLVGAVNVGGSMTIYRDVTTSTVGTEHALRIDVDRGNVLFRCGTTAGDGHYIAETSLGEGDHSLAFTPTDATYYVWFKTDAETQVEINSIAVESSGVMTLSLPYSTTELRGVRFDQSGDIVYLAHEDYQQRKIERRGTRSWSVVKYFSDTPPFTLGPTALVTLDPSGTKCRGNLTLSARSDFFESTHLGAMFRLRHNGQRVEQSFSTDGGANGQGEFTDVIALPLWPAGTSKPEYSFTATDTVAATGTWTRDTSFESANFGFASNLTGSGRQEFIDVQIDDTVDTWKRAGFASGTMSGGTWLLRLTTEHGGGYGICRVTGVSSGTSASIEVTDPFSNNIGTTDWDESEWSDRLGWPSAVCFFDGRLWWGGRDKLWGSVSDDYENFDDQTEGDAGPILRNVATGAVNQVRWLLPLIRLMVGTEGSEVVAKSSSLDNPLTPTEFSLRDISTQGSASVSPVKADGIGYFVQRSGKRLYALVFGDTDYASTDLTRLNDDIAGSGGFVELSMQRQPDTRVWCVRADGDVALCIHEPEEEVLGWVKIIPAKTNMNVLATEGTIESVCVLPGTNEDEVYCAVRRRVNGSAVRYVEKFAMESSALGVTGNHFMLDSYATEGSGAGTMSNLTHLNTEMVCAWGTASDGTTGPLFPPGHTTTVTDGVIALGMIDPRLCTLIGDMTSGGGLAAAFDGDVVQTSDASARKLTGTSAYVGLTLTGPSKIGRVCMRGCSSGSSFSGFIDGTSSITINLYAKTGAAPSSETDGTLLGTITFSDVSDNAQKIITSSDTTTEYSHVWVQITNAAATAMGFSEVQFFNPNTYTNVVAGLPYDWRYKSAKMAYGAQGATSLLQPKKVTSLGIVAQDFMLDSVKYGRDFDHLVPLPRIKDGVPQAETTVMTEHDERAFPFTGNWDTNSRVCMKGSAPYPFTALGIVVGIELEEKA